MWRKAASRLFLSIFACCFALPVAILMRDKKSVAEISSEMKRSGIMHHILPAKLGEWLGIGFELHELVQTA